MATVDNQTNGASVIDVDTVIDATKENTKVVNNFAFGSMDESTPFESNDDIPVIPKVDVKKEHHNEKTTGPTSTKNSRRNTPGYREKQIEYQNRIMTAKESAIAAAEGIDMYMAMRGIQGFSSNDPNRLVTYWVIDSPKGEVPVKGTIAEAFCFHGLAGTGGFQLKVMEWVENHPVAFGLFYIAMIMGYLEVIIIKAKDEAMKAEQVARTQDNVAVPET